MAKKATKKKEADILNLESILFSCRDYLRGSASLNEKRDVILTLVFLRFIGEKFDDAQAEMRQQCIDHGITDEEKIARFLDSPSRYKNIVYVPEAARWSMLSMCRLLALLLRLMKLYRQSKTVETHLKPV